MSLDECQGRVGHLAPARIDDERVPAVGQLDDLGHPRVALLLLVGSFSNRRRDGVILYAFDDQKRAALGILGVDLGLGPGVEVLIASLENSSPRAGTPEGAFHLPSPLLPTSLCETLPELFD